MILVLKRTFQGWWSSSPSWHLGSLLLPHLLLLSTSSFCRPFSSLLLLLLQKPAIKQRKIKLLKTLATRVDIEARDSRPESSGGEFAQIQSSQRFGHFQPNPLKIENIHLDLLLSPSFLSRIFLKCRKFSQESSFVT